MTEIPYAGNELELFSHAKNWKQYFAGRLKPFIKGSVLEVGAGLGGTTTQLCDGSATRWVCLEPDTTLFKQLEKKIINKELPACCSALQATTHDIRGEKFDTILYIDVIEHIEDDGAELLRAANLLAPGGNLIVLVPANQSLFSPFDEAIGHFRRYNKTRLRSAAPASLQELKMFYLDSLGLFASFINKFFLKQRYPTLSQVSFWDSFVIPFSKITDPIINFSRGKSLIGIWKNPTK